MTKCKACGNTFRKGTIAFLLTKDGFKGARVCQSCASAGVLIVPAALPAAPRAEKSEAELDATTCLRALARKLHKLAAKPSWLTQGDDPTKPGLEQAADIVDAWAKNPAARVSS